MVIENILFHSHDGARVVDLADACHVDRRTIYRDIAKLRATGVPIYQQHGRFFVSREYYLTNVQLNINETVVLFMAVRMMAQLAIQQNPHMVSVLNKLCATLPDSLKHHFYAVVDRLREVPIDRLFVTVVETLTRAWSENLWVRLWTSEAPEPLQLAPYFLEMTATGSVYVFGYDKRLEGIRAIRLNTILRVETLNQVFKRYGDFHPGTYLTDLTHIIRDDQPKTVYVELAFAPDIARLVLGQRVHHEVQIKKADDGRIFVSLHVTHWQSVLPWIRSLGVSVEVLQPEALRNAIFEEASQIASIYTSKLKHEVVDIEDAGGISSPG